MVPEDLHVIGAAVTHAPPVVGPFQAVACR